MSQVNKNKEIVKNSLDNDIGYTKDRWNNYISIKYESIRYKLKKTVLVRQKKINSRWVTMMSIYYKDAVKHIEKYEGDNNE